jgi:threonine dehydrogenase-like Zn-dependent dehydrogenase
MHTGDEVTDRRTAVAAVVVEHGQPVELQELPVPPLAPGDALIRVDAATLCGSDVHYWEGDPTIYVPTPYVPGHEGVGTVIDIAGTRTDHVGMPIEPGDRVVWAYPFCGHCFWCTVAGQPTLCPNAARPGRMRSDVPPYLGGTCAELQYVSARSALVRVPDTVNPAVAAATSCALRTVMHAIEKIAVPRPDETILVQGAGAVGLFMVAVAKAAGAGTILLIGNPRARVQLGARFGADDVAALDDFDAEARREWVLSHTSGRGADYVFQCATAMAIGEALDLVRPGGQVISIGGGGEASINASAFVKAVTFVTVRSGEARHYAAALAFVARHPEIPFDLLLDGPYPLASLTDGLEALRDLRSVKPVITPSPA